MEIPNVGAPVVAEWKLWIRPAKRLLVSLRLTQPRSHDRGDGRGAMQGEQNGQPTLFSRIALRYGPAGVLGRAIMATEQLALSKGVRLSFATGLELLAVNEANRGTWLPL